MASNQETPRDSDDIADWMMRRNAELRRRGPEALRAAHEAMGESARTGDPISAARPSEVLALGANVAGRINEGAKAAPAKIAGGVGDQLLAGGRGAQDAFTLGLGDRAYAGGRAIGDAIGGRDFGRAYEGRMAAERARDQYDAAHYGGARTTGQLLGLGAQVAALGPMEGAFVGAARIPQATALLGREVAALGGMGATAGLGGQAVSDLARGHPDSIGDYIGAGLGGAAQALASRSGRAGYAGAVGGAATSVAQDLANLRRPSIEKARDAAAVGGLFGSAGGWIGRTESSSMSRSAKENLGEDFSRVRTFLRGERTAAGPKSREYLQGGGFTIPDQRTYRGVTPKDIVESKFGDSARLSRRQRQAYNEPILSYRIDHTIPADVGAIFGFPMAGYGYQRFLSHDEK